MEKIHTQTPENVNELASLVNKHFIDSSFSRLLTEKNIFVCLIPTTSFIRNKLSYGC